MFQKDHTTETTTCSHGSRPDEAIPHPFRRRLRHMRRRRKMKIAQSALTPSHLQENPTTKRSWDRLNGRRKQRKLDMGCFTPPKAKRPVNLWAPLPATKSTTATTTTTGAANSRRAITTPTMSSTCKTSKRWGLPCPLVPNQPHILHP